MQINLNFDLWTALISSGFGMLVAAVLLVPIAYALHRRRLMSLKVKMMQRLPMTLEQIDADKDVIRAHHVVDLQRLKLRIAEIEATEAEANAKLHESLSRIDKLNRRIEVLQIKLAARKITKEIKRVDEQLIMLDSAESPADSVTIN
jgi:hypothetical protein